MVGLGDYRAALAMRDTMERIVRTTIDRERPRYRYATVQSIDHTNAKCHVIFNGESTVVTVNMGSIRPSAVGQIVRVAGIGTDKFVDDVMGPSSVEAKFNSIAARNADQPPSTYPVGPSVTFGGASVTGWPEEYGTVITNRHNNFRTTQFYHTVSNNIYGRTTTGADDVWSSWRKLKLGDINGDPLGATTYSDALMARFYRPASGADLMVTSGSWNPLSCTVNEGHNDRLFRWASGYMQVLKTGVYNVSAKTSMGSQATGRRLFRVTIVPESDWLAGQSTWMSRLGLASHTPNISLEWQAGGFPNFSGSADHLLTAGSVIIPCAWQNFGSDVPYRDIAVQARFVA